MDQPARGRNLKLLAGLALLAVVYGGFIHQQRPITGANQLDGTIGVLLGLYICSHPAANMLDLLFFRRGEMRQVSSRTPDVLWPLLNVAILFLGWTLIVIGTTRFTG